MPRPSGPRAPICLPDVDAVMQEETFSPWLSDAVGILVARTTSRCGCSVLQVREDSGNPSRRHTKMCHTCTSKQIVSAETANLQKFSNILVTFYLVD